MLLFLKLFVLQPFLRLLVIWALFTLGGQMVCLNFGLTILCIDWDKPEMEITAACCLIRQSYQSREPLESFLLIIAISNTNQNTLHIPFKFIPKPVIFSWVFVRSKVTIPSVGDKSVQKPMSRFVLLRLQNYVSFRLFKISSLTKATTVSCWRIRRTCTTAVCPESWAFGTRPASGSSPTRRNGRVGRQSPTSQSSISAAFSL